MQALVPAIPQVPVAAQVLEPAQAARAQAVPAVAARAVRVTDFDRNQIKAPASGWGFLFEAALTPMFR